MNELVIKRTSIFSLILGATLGLVALIPALMGLALFVLAFICPVIIISYMRAKENFFAILDTQQGATIGGLIGFFATIGFFITFCPMVILLHLIFKSYYTYAIPYIIQDAFWLFLIIVFMVGIMFAMTSAAVGMGVSFVMGRFLEKPKEYDAPLDIKIDD